ncbi:sarcosine oxidase subunit alpha family protein [Bradyrhizobium sp. NBAIM20]|uniref:sarcosine oxidase subunit alpha family protein n=1 Tax=unclassified Bradyrhizobium TaxID=2631580 RepID=UPI001CD25922|nr:MULTISPECIES: sarcosine oxidase subunit alpha family protein [unclassified Bradyrhizobium]MCA1414255.1 sarcosine oxidase subunit alpha family protein [Bradyrhizobium sp. NBAIM20]MCA1460638.1 sarcosine oxidase subunit alpha family protein [Bradyrhizobium sp. NBAIM18]
MSDKSAPQPNRIEGGLIDRSKALRFHFDGKCYQGFQGDTLASALLASGVRIVGRSFKYHRPRGIMTAGAEEPNALVELRSGARREPNTRATTIELFDGLEARSQNRWPSLRYDIGAVNSLLSPLFVAGFYYKTFMWPASFWERVYEPLIRRAAGLGKASLQPDPDEYEKAHAFCDVLVIGGGPGGLAAALAAGRAGARVIIADDDFIPGGRLNNDVHTIDGLSGAEWAKYTAKELDALPNVTMMLRTTIFGAYDGRTFGALERVSDHLPVPPAHQPRQRLWKIVAQRSILGAGAIERPIVFGGNDRPGIMLASAVRTYLNRYGVAPGKAATLFTSCDDGWRTALDLARAGVKVQAIIDARSEISPSLVASGQTIGARLLKGAHVVDTRGAHGLSQIRVRTNKGDDIAMESDLLAVSGGWNPNLALSTHLGGRPRWSEERSAFLPGDLPPDLVVIGAASGALTLAEALKQGAAAGAASADAAGFNAGVPPEFVVDDESIAGEPLWQVSASRSKAFVDYQNDVTQADIALAAREGFTSVEHLKRYTTLGMATDQGKMAAVIGHAMMAALTDRPMQQVGTTIARPPVTPVAIGAFAGRHRGQDFRPVRLAPSHRWAEQLGATFVDAGPWRRAQWFARAGEADWLSTVIREVKTVRSAVGVCDVSTLGKIDVQGADAGIFLDRIYINTFSTLPVGKVRYGLMLREDGIAMDDGTCARFAPDHYVMSTTTANAAKVMQHLDHARQVLWPELDVQAISVTEQWAQFAIAGPRGRELLDRLLGGAIDISDAAFPYLACAEFRWRQRPARLFRVSFSGELGYELAVPARFADETIRAIMEAGAGYGLTPYGTEALGVMRIEKGHVAGNELNGTTTAHDLGLGRMVGKKDFIGKVLSRRPGLVDPDRPAVIGLKPIDRRQRLRNGAHLLSPGAAVKLENDQGYVTSSAFSPMLGHWIALALLTRGRERVGQILRVVDPLRGADFEAEICSPVFYDPEGARLRG